MTSKLQVTIPKVIADRYEITPGDELEWIPAGDAVRVVPARSVGRVMLSERLALFDAASRRQREREKGQAATSLPPAGRGWTRDELYDRDSSR